MTGLHRHLAEALVAERTRELSHRRTVHERQRELVRASLLWSSQEDPATHRRSA